jgi:hypothetical protein
MAAAPLAARIAGNELADPLRNYGHLLIRAARFARERLDGRAVVNRATALPIGFSWEHGLKQAVASGTPPELLLALPALPRLLTWARYVGALADPARRPQARRLLVFAAAMELARRRVEARLVVREDRSGHCHFDRILLCGKSSLERYAGLDDGDWGPCGNNDRSRAMRAVLRPPARGFADGGDTTAADAPAASAAAVGETPTIFGGFVPDNGATLGAEPPLDLRSPAPLVSGVTDAEQGSAPSVPSAAERAAAAQRFTQVDATADRLEQHIDETTRVAGISPAPPSATGFPLNPAPDQANSTLATIEAPATTASGSHDDAGRSWLGWADDLVRSQDPFYSLHKWELNRAFTAAADEGQALAEDEIRTSPFSYDSSGKLIAAASDQLGRPSVSAHINKAMYGTEDPQPSNIVERYLGRVAGGFGANPVLGAIFPWATTAGELLGETATDVNEALGSPLSEWQARLIGNVAGGAAGVPGAVRAIGQGARAIGSGIANPVQGLVPGARSWIGEAAQRFTGARRAAPPPVANSDPVASPRLGPTSRQDPAMPAAQEDPAPTNLAANGVAPEGSTNGSLARSLEDVPSEESQRSDPATGTAASLPKWRRIPYRDSKSKLAELTYRFRRKENVSAKRNVAGLRYEAPNKGPKGTLFAASVPFSQHAEEVLLDKLAGNKIDRSWVKELYSELQPCRLAKIGDAPSFLRRIFPKPA